MPAIDSMRTTVFWRPLWILRHYSRPTQHTARGPHAACESFSCGPRELSQLCLKEVTRLSFSFSCSFLKTNNRCLVHRAYLCNGTINCANTSFCDIGCPDYYTCRDGSCVHRTTVCDGNACRGCAEDDEWKTGIGFKCIRNGQTCRLPQQLLWDNVQDCDDGSDICYSFNISHSDGR